MILSEIIFAFEADYKFECFKRDVKEIIINAKFKALMLSKIVSDIQKRLGVIELTATYNSIAGSSAYSISSKLINPKVVKFGDYVLEKTTTEWIKKQTIQTGQPYKYAILQEGATANLYLFPVPDIAGTDNIFLQANYNFGLYSPNAGSSHDFGAFDGSDFSGNLTLPQQYEQAILLGMMKQIFKEFEVDYEKEMNLLKVIQYNGEGFEYGFNDHTETKEVSVPTTGSVMINEITSAAIDSADKYIRFTIVYGAGGTSTLIMESQKGWNSIPTLQSDDGNIITIVSADNEFAATTLVLKNNENVDANRVNTGEITLNYFGANFGTLTVIIGVWT